MNGKAADMAMSKRDETHNDPSRDKKAEDAAQTIAVQDADDVFADRGAVDVSSPHGDDAAENRVATSLDDE